MNLLEKKKQPNKDKIACHQFKQSPSRPREE